MKLTLEAKIIIETDKFRGYWEQNDLPELTLAKIKQEIDKGHYVVEWINGGLVKNEPTIIIKI